MNGYNHATGEEREYYSLNEKVYPKLAPFYELVVLPLSGFRREVAAAAQIDASSRVLDVATGTGAQARVLAQRARGVVGVDLSEAMLRVARARNRSPNLTFSRCDAARLPFDDGSFDAACISFALHEMPPSVRERVISEIARVTRPGGTVLVVDYRQRPGLFGTAVHRIVKLYEGERYAEFARSDLLALMREAGIDTRRDEGAVFGLVRVVTGVRR